MLSVTDDKLRIIQSVCDEFGCPPIELDALQIWRQGSRKTGVSNESWPSSRTISPTSRKLNFNSPTLNVYKAIDGMQKQQEKNGALRNLNRLRPFLDAMDQFGKVLDTFANSSEFVPFIWVGSNTLSS